VSFAETWPEAAVGRLFGGRVRRVGEFLVRRVGESDEDFSELALRIDVVEFGGLYAHSAPQRRGAGALAGSGRPLAAVALALRVQR
jgi:hypothetical protein